jgi:hypothetical protein
MAALVKTLGAAGEEAAAATWSILSLRGSWPHVAFREAYVTGQLSAAIAAGHEGRVEDAMRSLDMALMMGAPAEELDRLVSAVDSACYASQSARNAYYARVAADGPPASPAAGDAGLTTTSLPIVPRVLGPAAAIGHIPLPSPGSAIPRVAGQPYSRVTGGSKGGPKGGKGGGTAAKEALDPVGPEHPALATARALTSTTKAAKPLSLADFRAQWVRKSRPVVLVGATKLWPAMDAWRNLPDLVERVGHRTVPVELGQHLSGTWSEKPMTVAAFVASYLAPSLTWGWGAPTPDAMAPPVVGHGGTDGASAAGAGAGGTAAVRPHVDPARIAYMAQHTLFDQMPQVSRSGKREGGEGGGAS